MPKTPNRSDIRGRPISPLPEERPSRSPSPATTGPSTFRLQARLVAPNAILGAAAEHLAHNRFADAIDILHDGPRARLGDETGNPIYTALVTCYRRSELDGDYVAQRIDRGLSRAELEVFAFTFDRFIAIANSIPAGSPKRKLFEPHLPYTHFYAGAFALARGETDKAYDHFNLAANLWGTEAQTVANHLVSGKTTDARNALGARFTAIQRALTEDWSPPIASPVTPRTIPAAPPGRTPPAERKAVFPSASASCAAPARRFPPARANTAPVDRSHAEAILSSARREAQNNPTNAFSLFNEAVALVGWTDAVIAARTTIMATILNHHLPSRTQDIAKCLRVTDGFIKTMPEEPLLHLRRADFLIQAQRFEEARAALNRARELAYTEDEVQEANYYEAYLIHREKGSYATALRLLDTVPRDHPRYPDVLRIRLMLEIRTRRVEAGFATLEEARTLDAVSPSRLQEAEAELLFLRGDPRSLQKAHRLATEALRDASPTSARSITHLLERIANAQRNPGR